MAAPILQIRRGLAANINNALLKAGEPAFTTNTNDFYIGLDGTAGNQKFFGSARYWTRENGTSAALLKLVDKNGTNSVNLKAADTLSGIVTFTLPSTLGVSGQVLSLTDNAGTIGFTTITPGYASTAGVSTSANNVVVYNTGNTGTFFPAFFNSSASSTGVGYSAFVDSGISFNASTDSLVINGNLSVGGTTVTLNVSNLLVKDRDIVVGYTTDVNGNDASTDATATHGGISVASTVGSPIINMPQVTGINSLPFTYKQFMWVAAGTQGYTGMSTDAWVSNYAISVGNTSNLLTGTRFAVGTGFTVFDTYVDASPIDLRIRNISASTSGVTTVGFITATSEWVSGILTAGNANLTSGGTYQIGGTTVLSNNTLGSGVVNSSLTSVGTLTNLNVSTSGITTVGFITATSGYIGILTAGTISATNISGTLTGTISTATRAVTVDTTTAPNGTFYPGLFANSTGTASTSVYVDAGISYVSNTDSLTLAGNLSVNGSTVDTTSATINLFNTNAATVNEYGSATAITIGANSSTGITTIRSGTLVGTQATQNVYNTTATTVNAFGAATALNMGAASGTATINNSTVTLSNASTLNINGASPTIASSSTGTLTFFNTGITAVNEYGAATAISIGANSGTVTINNPTLVGSQATQNLYNTVATTVNAFGAATSIGIGSITGTLTLNNPTVVGSQATQNLYNTVATTVNAFGAANTIQIGASTGITTVRNSLRVTNSLYDSSNAPGTLNQFLTVTSAGIGWTTITGISTVGLGVTRSQGVDVTATNAQTGNIVFASAGLGATLYNDTDLSYDSSANRLTGSNITASTEVRTPSIKAGDGTNSITITNSTGAVGFANSATVNGDFTVGGNLFVNGTSSVINTQELQVYDRTITLGIQSGTVPTNTSWDLGVMLDYGNVGTAQTAGIIWKSSLARFQLASNISNPTVGINTTLPTLNISAAANFAPIEVGALWVSDTAGIGTVIVSYLTAGAAPDGVTAGRYLQNILVDAGTF